MNYRHVYHAGNFADVFKHVILLSLVQSLLRKETAFCYLETHAGIGRYDLFSEEAQKSREFENGIKKIIDAKNPPALIQDYLSCVTSLNQPNELRYYPGSPFFANYCMRPQDRMVLSEFHPDDVKTLKKYFARNKQVAVHHQDGYQSLKAFLPPKERRGLVLIDPPYEKNNELMELPSVLAQALTRWKTGMYAVWYPIKGRNQSLVFHRELKKIIHEPFLIAELNVYADDVEGQLSGAGMVVIHPPWQLEETLENTLFWLSNVLCLNKSSSYALMNSDKIDR